VKVRARVTVRTHLDRFVVVHKKTQLLRVSVKVLLPQLVALKL
jgi:hypothetical protein